MSPLSRARESIVLRTCAVVLAAVLAACGSGGDRTTGRADDDAPREVPEGAVAPRALSGPGSELGDGFAVAEGSALIAVPVPLGTTVIQDGAPVVDPGWRAHIYVWGDPGAVVDDYLAQAEGNGLRVNAAPQTDPFAMEGEENPPTGYHRCGLVGDRSYECAAAAGDGAGRCLVLELVRSDRASHLSLTLFLNDPFGCASPGGLPATTGDPPQPAARWPARPAVGEPFGDAWGTLSPLTVQDGSAVVAAPVARSQCREPIAVLRVTSEPTAVLDRYAAEIERISTVEPAVATEERSNGARTLRRHIAQEMGGGRRFVADLVTDDAGASWLFLEGCQG